MVGLKLQSHLHPNRVAIAEDGLPALAEGSLDLVQSYQPVMDQHTPQVGRL